MDTIHRINHKKIYYFNAPSLGTSASHKIMTKMCYFISKDTVLNGETNFRHTFRCID